MGNYIEADAIFEGGGIRGIGIAGALKSFENHNYVWKRVGGTSVGAIIASLLAAGYTASDLEKIILDLDFSKFLDKDSINKIPVVGTAIGILKDKGIYSGEYFENWIKDLLAKKNIVTFGDVFENNKTKLKVVASDITLKRKFIIPDDLHLYNKDYKDFSIAKAVRMSMSIPFYFKPVEFNYGSGVSYIVDGGITSNYPINIFDDDAKIRPIIGFKFDEDKNAKSLTAQGYKDTISFLFDIASTMSEYSFSKDISYKDKQQTINIPVSDEVKATDFHITKEKAEKLFKSGEKAANDFLLLNKNNRYIKNNFLKKIKNTFFKK